MMWGYQTSGVKPTNMLRIQKLNFFEPQKYGFKVQHLQKECHDG